MTPPAESCGTCRYWRLPLSGATAHTGECRRRPPRVVPVLIGAPRSAFPVTHRDVWCAEYSPRADAWPGAVAPRGAQ